MHVLLESECYKTLYDSNVTTYTCILVYKYWLLVCCVTVSKRTWVTFDSDQFHKSKEFTFTSISRNPPSATSNIKLIFVPDVTLSKKHSSA